MRISLILLLILMTSCDDQIATQPATPVRIDQTPDLPIPPVNSLESPEVEAATPTPPMPLPASMKKELTFEEALNAAAEKGTYEAYHTVAITYPSQNQLVVIEGGIGGSLSRSIDMAMLCPVDRPRLEEIAAAQGVSMSDIRGFPGFRIGPPPMEWTPDPMTISFDERRNMPDRETRSDFYGIPQWLGQDLGLYTEKVTREGNTVSRSSTFSQNRNKVFNFVGQKYGDKYRIVAAQLLRIFEKP